MSSSKPDPGPVLDLLNAFRRSQCLLTAVDLGVFDTLAASSSPLTAEQLAKVLPPRSTSSASASSPNGDTATTAGAGFSHDGVDRLCRALVSLGLLEAHAATQQQHQDHHDQQQQQEQQQQEDMASSLHQGGSSTPPYGFSLTPCAAAYLVAQSPDSLAGYCVHSQKVGQPHENCQFLTMRMACWSVRLNRRRARSLPAAVQYRYNPQAVWPHTQRCPMPGDLLGSHPHDPIHRSYGLRLD